MTPIINGKKKEIAELESLRANMLGVGENGGWSNSKSLLPKKPVGSYTSGRERISGTQTPEQERNRQQYAPGTGGVWAKEQRGVDNPAKNHLVYRIEGLDPTKPFMPQYEEHIRKKGREAWEAWLESERNPPNYEAQPFNAEHSGESKGVFLCSDMPAGQMGLNETDEEEENKDEKEKAEERISEIDQEIARISEEIDTSYAWIWSGAVSGVERDKYQQDYKDGLDRIAELEKEKKKIEDEQIKYPDDEYWTTKEEGGIKKEHIEAIKDPLGGINAYINSKKAIELSEQKYGYCQDGTRQNALQHALWNALMTIGIGEERAKKFADAHEEIPYDESIKEKTGYPHEEHTEMDYFYNELGRRAGLEIIEKYSRTRPDGSIVVMISPEEVADYVDAMIEENLSEILKEYDE